MAIAKTPARTRYLPLPFPRFESIRSRILVFAVLSSLVPTGIMLGIFYTQNHRALEKKIAEDLKSESAQSARATGVWLKERLYDLRVFAGSDEVVNTLFSASSSSSTPMEGRLRDYLVSLHERFGDFEQLMVLDLDGHVVATSGSEIRALNLPGDWQTELRSDGQIVGDAYWDPKARRAKLIVAVPAQRADGRLIGAFAAELNLEPVQLLLRSFAPDSSGAIYLMNTKGAVITSSEGASETMVRTPLPPGRMKSLLTHVRSTVDYNKPTGVAIGSLEYVPQVSWAVVSEISADAAYKQIRAFRDFAMMAVAILLVGVSALAYRFGLLIARPLDRLAEAAAEVAAGDLAVDLPEAAAGGEVGYLTGVFNHMVARLRDGRRELDRIHEQLRKQNEELEQLSTTDSLTGLANHRSLIQSLEDAESRFKRDRRAFSILVADVDHFKQYNDAFGHPAGDEVLKGIAEVMQESTRPVDCVARYGGEEFVILLPDTSAFDALEIAEHIRARVAAKTFPGRKITLSIGVSEFPTDGESGEKIIAVADEALYQAKREGRDRAIRARRLAKTGS